MSDEIRQAIKYLLSDFSGQRIKLVIPRPYITLTGDIAAALLLSQCVYWSDRTSDPERWFAKSYIEWEEELGLSQYQVSRAAKLLEQFGLQTKVKKFDGSPTVHYRIDMDVFSQSIMKKLDNGLSRNSILDYEETSQSITEITTENTTDISCANFSDENSPQNNGPVKQDWSDRQLLPEKRVETRSEDEIKRFVQNTALESLLAKTSKRKKLTEKQQELLKAPVTILLKDGTEKTYPSPHELYETSEPFQIFAKNQVHYFSGRNMPTGRIVELLRNYGHDQGLVGSRCFQS